MSRNTTLQALNDLAAPLMKDVGGFLVARSRKFKLWADVPAGEQPCLFQTEPHEQQTQKTRMASIRTWHANWTIYFRSDESDPSALPALQANDIVDAIEALFVNATDPVSGAVTLGGVAQHVFIDGMIIKVAGDEDGQGMIVIPITLLVP